MTQNELLKVKPNIKIADIITLFLLGDNGNAEIDIFEHNTTAYDGPTLHLIRIDSEELEPFYDRTIECICEPPTESAAMLEIHLQESQAPKPIKLKLCRCIENKHHNANFTLNEVYEVKINSPYIKTNDLWTSHYTNIVPDEKGIFTVGMCKFKIVS